MSTLYESLIPNYSILQPEIATSDIIFLNRLPSQNTTIPRCLKSNDRLLRYDVFCKSWMHIMIDLDLAGIWVMIQEFFSMHLWWWTDVSSLGLFNFSLVYGWVEYCKKLKYAYDLENRMKVKCHDTFGKQIYDFLYVNNSDLHAICDSFRDIGHWMSIFCENGPPSDSNWNYSALQQGFRITVSDNFIQHWTEYTITKEFSK